mmetsp:Transcript_20091/g.32698  ORF Transcript_20091/g.32698 Transcript_20091/m.32698 type:complete len:313 (-) Transcript_20091:128-1066(-)
MCIGFPIPPRNVPILQAQVVEAIPASILAEKVSVTKTAPHKKKRVRTRKRSERKPRTTRKLKKPKRPKTAYNYFQLEERSRAQTGSLVHDEKFARTIGKLWKNLSPERRAHYQKMADKDRCRYEQEDREYLKALAGNMQKVQSMDEKKTVAVKVEPKVEATKAEMELSTHPSPISTPPMPSDEVIHEPVPFPTSGSKRPATIQTKQPISKKTRYLDLPELVDIDFDDGSEDRNPEISSSLSRFDDFDLGDMFNAGSPDSFPEKLDENLPSPSLDLKPFDLEIDSNSLRQNNLYDSALLEQDQTFADNVLFRF